MHRLTLNTNKQKDIARRWRGLYGHNKPLPKSARRVLVRLNLLLAARTLSGERLVVLMQQPPPSSSSSDGGFSVEFWMTVGVP